MHLVSNDIKCLKEQECEFFLWHIPNGKNPVNLVLMRFDLFDFALKQPKSIESKIRQPDKTEKLDFLLNYKLNCFSDKNLRNLN